MEKIEIVARTCYEAERAYNRSNGRKEQMPWEDLSAAHKTDYLQQVETLRNKVSPTARLSTRLQLWAAIINVLMPVRQHNQD